MSEKFGAPSRVLEKEIEEMPSNPSSNGGERRGSRLPPPPSIVERDYSNERENLPEILASWKGGDQRVAGNIERALGLRDLHNREAHDSSIIIDVLESDDAESRVAMGEFLAQSLLREQGLGLGSDPESRSEYNVYRDRLQPYIEQAFIRLSESGTSEDTLAIRHMMESLASANEQSIATSMLFEAEMSLEERLRLGVDHMNVFGVVSTVEDLLPYVDDNLDIEDLVKTIQGENGSMVMTTLTAVYQAVEFREYALNNEDLTHEEAERIQSIVTEYAEKKGIPVEQVHIADVGAGTGRHSILLNQEGFDVKAYEYEGKHVLQIKEEAPDLDVVQADWHNMPLPSAGEATPDNPQVMFCLGRTILHNNSPEKMARFFDEMHRVLKDEGMGIIDIPEVPEDIDSGDDEYSQNAREYASHLQSIGVLPNRAKNIYDGPDEAHKFNRMAMTQFQFESYAKLFGFKVEKLDTVPVGKEGLFDNSYYKIEKDPDFDISKIPTREMLEMLYGIGLYHPGVDYNKQVDAWGVPLGIPFARTTELEADIGRFREQAKEGSLQPVRFEVRDGKLVFMHSG